MANWFLINDKSPLPAAVNMARDEYLFHLCHREKIGFFRIYSWDNPTYSFGVSQKIDRAVDVEYLEKKGFSYVRRITGGKTVLHDDEITYTVVSSEETFYKDNDLYRSYMLISSVLVTAFQNLGIDAYLSQGSPSHLSKSNNPCFSFPTPNELEIAGKKIVGSAQKRDKFALLQHGSIPIRMDYEEYARGTRSDAGLIKEKMTTLSGISNKKRSDLAGTLIAAFQEFIGKTLQEYEFDGQAREEISVIEKKYRSRDWNFRI